MSLPPVPDWLKSRDGTLKPAVNGHAWFVMLENQPHYRLDVRPAKGQHTCVVTQTVNGRRLDDAVTYPNAEAALAGGLEQLRAKLGW